jgi:hypothetical protein
MFRKQISDEQRNQQGKKDPCQIHGPGEAQPAAGETSGTSQGVCLGANLVSLSGRFGMGVAASIS